MPFLVISSSHSTRSSEIKELRKKYWPWAQDKLNKN